MLIFCIVGCNSSNAVFLNKKGGHKKSAPTGKYRNSRMFSSVNPFQGRAKMRLTKSKKQKINFIKKKHKQRGKYRGAPKPGRTFDMKRTMSRGRLKSSGSRAKTGAGSGKKNKNLFNTRKK